MTFVARTLDDFTKAPSGEVLASTKDVMAATRLSILPVRGALSVLLSAELLERIGPTTSTRYRWNLQRLEELAAGVEVHTTQLAKNESSVTSDDVVAAPRHRAPSATFHIDVAASQGVCRAFGIILDTEEWITASGLGAWKKNRPRSWYESVDRIEVQARLAGVEPAHYARVFFFTFCSEDAAAQREGGCPWPLVNSSRTISIWTKVTAKLAAEERAKGRERKPKATQSEPVKSDVTFVQRDGAAETLERLTKMAGGAR